MSHTEDREGFIFLCVKHGMEKKHAMKLLRITGVMARLNTGALNTGITRGAERLRESYIGEATHLITKAGFTAIIDYNPRWPVKFKIPGGGFGFLNDEIPVPTPGDVQDS